MNLIYLEKIPASEREAFAKRVKAIASILVVDPNWLMQVMWAESKLDPKAVNYQPGDVRDPFERAAKRATGLLQFMPNTAKELGTTTQALYKMTALQQLDFVLKYFYRFRGRMKSYYDVYFVTFFPLAIGKSDDWVFQSKDASAYTVAKQNPAVNKNKDGKITVAEFKAYVFNSVNKIYRSKVFGAAAGGAAAAMIIGISLFFYSVTKEIVSIWDLGQAQDKLRTTMFKTGEVRRQ